jgi:5-methylcytosine-specific restriction endonuclease McrA
LATSLHAIERQAWDAERPDRRAQVVARALSRSDPPQSFSLGWRNRISSQDLIPHELVKRMNAMHLHLLAGLEREPRLDDEAWEALRQHVLAEDRYKCRICDEYPHERHVHHIIPLSKHGSNHPNNLITLCYRCHDRAHPDFHVQQFRPAPTRRGRRR